MIIEKEIGDLTQVLNRFRNENKRIGLVPTMGALHQGHLSLIRACKAENDITVVSIFINPTQFNDKTDFDKYPRDNESDFSMLDTVGTDLVFVPETGEMYPEKDNRVFDFGHKGNVMEGLFRPGHFNGVAQVVSKLFDIIKPQAAYFGEKDFQQLAIIREMTRQLKLSISIRACPTIREADGLALSSRNRLLSTEERKAAAKIPKALFKMQKMIPKISVKELKNAVLSDLDKDPALRVEYFEIVDASSLHTFEKLDKGVEAIACIAVYSGRIRLIDNVKISC